MNGGIFLDSDAIFEGDVDDIIKSYDSVFVKSFSTNTHLFNGFIATYPKNPIIYDALKHAYETDDIVLQTHYHYFCEELWRIYHRHNIPNMKIYQEYSEGSGVAVMLDDVGEKIISHYWGTKIIPNYYYYKIDESNMREINNNETRYLDAALLSVYNTPNNLIRLGPNHDGGYVILDKLEYDHFISCGIDKDIRFEIEFLNRYPHLNCDAFDGTIDTFPNHNKNIKWVAKNIDKENSDTTSNLVEYITNYQNIFLKMDIEGREFNWIDSMNTEDLNRFSQITIEFHWPYDKYRYRMVTKLLNTHLIVHMHGNNGPGLTQIGKQNLHIPEVLELTLVRKDIFNNNELESITRHYPINNLDYGNDTDQNRPQLEFTIYSDNTIYVGSSNHNNKEVILPIGVDINNININNIPVNKQEIGWTDTFSTTIVENKLIVSRIDVNHGWGQDLVFEFEKKNYCTKIPKLIFQKWNTKNLGFIQKYSDSWKNYNKNYEYHLFDDKDCLDFLSKHFDPNIVDCYKRLLAPAHKCDFWRICCLYIYGGVYIDIDTLCLNSIDDFLQVNSSFIVPVPYAVAPNEGTHPLINGFIASTPKHKILEKAIELSCYNINNNILPESVLDFSGPGVLGKAVNWYLNRQYKSSFVGREGILNDVCLLKFESNTEFVTRHNKKLFQNKNGNSQIIQDYNNEISKINNYIDWCSEYKSGNFHNIIETNNNKSESRKILVYNGFPFHFEMFGCVLDYAKDHNLGVDIVNTTEVNHQWFSLYQKHFSFSLYNSLSDVDINHYKSVILLTDDDYSFPKNLVSENTISINHFHLSRRTDIIHQLPISKFTEDIDNFCFPIWNCITLNEKKNILEQTNKPIITLIGSCNIHNTNNIKKIIKNYQDFEFILINRDIPNNIPNFIRTYENLDSLELFDILKQSSYVLYLQADHNIAIHQQNNRVISGCFPLAVSNGCQLIIPNGIMKPLNLKSIIYYDIDNPIQLNKITNLEEVLYDRDRLTETINHSLQMSMSYNKTD